MPTLKIQLLFVLIVVSPNLFGQIDTVSFPGLPVENNRIISFYQDYVNKQEVKVHFVLNASPTSNGENWATRFAEGTLKWREEVFLEGTLDVRFNSSQEDVGMLLARAFKSNEEKIELEVDTRNGKISVKGDDYFVYPSKIRNRSIYGFNNSNQMIILTFEKK